MPMPQQMLAWFGSSRQRFRAWLMASSRALRPQLLSCTCAAPSNAALLGMLFWLAQRSTAMPEIKSACSPLSEPLPVPFPTPDGSAAMESTALLCLEIVRKKICGQLIGIDQQSQPRREALCLTSSRDVLRSCLTKSFQHVDKRCDSGFPWR